jgi:hypothetical protein
MILIIDAARQDGRASGALRAAGGCIASKKSMIFHASLSFLNLLKELAELGDVEVRS